MSNPNSIPIPGRSDGASVLSSNIAEDFLNNRTWFLQPYRDLVNLSEQTGALHLNAGLDNATLSRCHDELISTGRATRLPKTYLDFLRLINGFECEAAGIKIFNAVEIWAYATERIPDPTRQYKLRGYTMGSTVSPASPDLADFLYLGRCDHGTYYYRCDCDSYHLDLINGGVHQFNDCPDMLNHMIIRLRENMR